MATGKRQCGEFLEVAEVDNPDEFETEYGRGWEILADMGGAPGDSGSPVWDETTGKSIGLVKGLIITRDFADVWNTETVTEITPLIHPKGVPVQQAPGIFGDPVLGNIDLEEAQ